MNVTLTSVLHAVCCCLITCQSRTTHRDADRSLLTQRVLLTVDSAGCVDHCSVARDAILEVYNRTNTTLEKALLTYDYFTKSYLLSYRQVSGIGLVFKSSDTERNSSLGGARSVSLTYHDESLYSMERRDNLTLVVNAQLDPLDSVVLEILPVATVPDRMRLSRRLTIQTTASTSVRLFFIVTQETIASEVSNLTMSDGEKGYEEDEEVGEEEDDSSFYSSNNIDAANFSSDSSLTSRRPPVMTQELRNITTRGQTVTSQRVYRADLGGLCELLFEKEYPTAGDGGMLQLSASVMNSVVVQGSVMCWSSGVNIFCCKQAPVLEEYRLVLGEHNQLVNSCPKSRDTKWGYIISDLILVIEGWNVNIYYATSCTNGEDGYAGFVEYDMFFDVPGDVKVSYVTSSATVATSTGDTVRRRSEPVKWHSMQMIL